MVNRKRYLNAKTQRKRKKCTSFDSLSFSLRLCVEEFFTIHHLRQLMRNGPGLPALWRAIAVLPWLLLGLSSHAAQLVWQSGFENGFPGREWLDYDDGAFSPNGSMPANRVSAWTIVHRQSGEPVYSGDHAYKGWITSASSISHRAYPGIHADIATPVINTFMVYLDTDYDQMAPADWIHFGTWGNHDPALKTGAWALHTMSVRNRKLEFAHTSPFRGEYIGPGIQPDFPLGHWVRFTVYILYAGTDGFVQVWQDGAPMLRAKVSQLRKHPGTKLRTAHWGMYASANVAQAVQYNDDIRICTLKEPLTDLVREPHCPYKAEIVNRER